MTPVTAGKFITFEGGEGAGKSTQIALLAEALEAAGNSVTQTREPGGAPGAERIRTLLVEGDADQWEPFTETLLHYAARREHLERTVRPALARGDIVLCDRFADSTLAYQGYGQGVPAERIGALHDLVVEGLTVNLTLILDMRVEEGLRRAQARGDDAQRYERMGTEFHNRLREGFLAIAERESQRCAVIDATGDREEVSARIQAIVAQRLPDLFG